MTRSTMNVAVSADYADALMTARKAKTWLFVLLLLFVLAQLTIFLLARFNVLKLGDAGATQATSSVTTPGSGGGGPATAPSDLTDAAAAATQPAVAVETTTTPSGGTAVTAATRSGRVTFSVSEGIRYLISAINFLAILLGVVLCVVMLLLTMIMLVGRLIGVSHVTSAFIWSVFLVLLLFPWQAFLISGPRNLSQSPGDTATSPAFAEAADDQYPAFKIPGVLYTYPELAQDYRFNNSDIKTSILKWGRYAAMPLVALVLLLTVNGKANRGLRLALGEADIQVEVANRTNDPLV